MREASFSDIVTIATRKYRTCARGEPLAEVRHSQQRSGPGDHVEEQAERVRLLQLVHDGIALHGGGGGGGEKTQSV